MILVISDNSEYVYLSFRDSFPGNFCLLSNDNFDQRSDSGFYFTSLADLDEKKVIQACLESSAVYYKPPFIWNSLSLQKYTEDTLKKLTDVYQLNIQGFTSALADLIKLKNTRQTQDKNFWLVGCSYAGGKGLGINEERYGNLISRKMQMPLVDLTEPGSSIDWAADQILRSDIRKGDIVLWGITGVNRVSYINDKRQHHINQSWVKGINKSDQKFFLKLLTDDNIVYQSIKRIKEVINFCNKIDASLILVNHRLSIKEHHEILVDHLQSEDNYLSLTPPIDRAPDSALHPGLKTHANWAEEIYNFIRDKK